MPWLSPPRPPRVMILNQVPSITIIFNDNITTIEQAEFCTVTLQKKKEAFKNNSPSVTEGYSDCKYAFFQRSGIKKTTNNLTRYPKLQMLAIGHGEPYMHLLIAQKKLPL